MKLQLLRSPLLFLLTSPALQAAEYSSDNGVAPTHNITRMEEVCQRQGYELSNNYQYNIEYDDIENRRWSPETEFDGWGRHATTDDPPCPSPKSNIRASYTSHLVPCTFVFHKLEHGEEAHGPMELSNRCSHRTEYNDGSTTVLEDFVIQWPDACVADFARCYSIEQHESVWAKLFCLKRWIVPDGVTHVAVDCRVDKAEKVKRQEQFKLELEKQRVHDIELEQERSEEHTERNAKETILEQENYFLHREEELKQEAIMMVFGILTILSFCLITMLCTYRRVLRPFWKQKVDRENEILELGSWSPDRSHGSPVSLENGDQNSLQYSLLHQQRRPN